MSNTKHTLISLSGQHFYVVIDVHKKRWSVTEIIEAHRFGTGFAIPDQFEDRHDENDF